MNPSTPLGKKNIPGMTGNPGVMPAAPASNATASGMGLLAPRSSIGAVRGGLGAPVSPAQAGGLGGVPSNMRTIAPTQQPANVRDMGMLASQQQIGGAAPRGGLGLPVSPAQQAGGLGGVTANRTIGAGYTPGASATTATQSQILSAQPTSMPAPVAPPPVMTSQPRAASSSSGQAPQMGNGSGFDGYDANSPLAPFINPTGNGGIGSFNQQGIINQQNAMQAPSRAGYDSLTGAQWNGNGQIFQPAQGVGPGGVPLPQAGNGIGGLAPHIQNAVQDAGGWDQYQQNMQDTNQSQLNFIAQQNANYAGRNTASPSGLVNNNTAASAANAQSAKDRNAQLRADRQAADKQQRLAAGNVARTTALPSAQATASQSPQTTTGQQAATTSSPPPAPVAPPPGNAPATQPQNGLLDINTVNQETNPIYSNQLMRRSMNQQLADMARVTPESSLKQYERGGMSRSAGTQSRALTDLAKFRGQAMGNIAQDQFGMRLGNEQNRLDQQYRRELEALGLARNEFGLQDAYNQLGDQDRQRQMAILNAMLRGAGALNSFGGY